MSDRPSFWVAIFLMLALIGLYLILGFSGGTTSILNAIGNVTIQQTKTLQGR